MTTRAWSHFDGVGRVHYGWIVAGAMFLVILVGAAVRAVLPRFFDPIGEELGWSLATLSYVTSGSILAYGLSQPVAGRYADRFGPRVVLTAAVALCGLGAVVMSRTSSLWVFTAAAVALVGTGAGAASITVGTTIAARWFTDRRALVVSIAGAGAAAGISLAYPIAGTLTRLADWRTANLVMGLAMLAVVLPLAAWLIRSDPADVGLRPHGDDGAPRSAAAAAADARLTTVGAAMRTAGFWLLAGSFFVCGYTSFGVVGTHLFPHATRQGFTAAQTELALFLMGGMNIVGTMLSGWFCDRLGHKRPLAFFYFFRGLALLILLWIPNIAVLDAWAVLFGLNYIATVPPTAAMTANLFGRRSVGAIFGVISLAHQIGAALGAALGGFTYDLFGTYTFTWLSAALLAMAAAVMALLVPNAATGLPTGQAEPGERAPAGAPAAARA
ncbi:MAG TPA: MFS transporter [Thermodesulfobacteriota bacterium]